MNDILGGDIEKNGTCREEKWTFGQCIYDVNVTYGKQIDILSLKSSVVEDFSLSVERKGAEFKRWMKAENRTEVKYCPICDEGIKTARKVATAYQSSYYQCSKCTHCFLVDRLSEDVLRQYFERDDNYRKTYTDKKLAEERVDQVAIPKVNWVLREFERIYGRPPRAVLDVGSGGGHFVHACRRCGIRADGIEISDSGIEFSRNQFGIELKKIDFLRDYENILSDTYEIITFWGVIECVPDPLGMLNTARRILHGRDGMVVAEVPRWNSLSTVIQQQFSSSIIRHLDPIGHINIFTEASLAESFKKNSLNIVSAWYFGMDAYELSMQLSYALKDVAISKLANVIGGLQRSIDMAKLSDEVVFAGITED